MYTVDYFIEKFSKIPDELWHVGEFKNGDKYCANGHCGMTKEYQDGTEESLGLIQVFIPIKITTLQGYIREQSPYANYSNKAALVNDGRTREYQQESPKARILAALYDIKKLQQPKTEAFIPETIRKQAKELISVRETISELELMEG